MVLLSLLFFDRLGAVIIIAFIYIGTIVFLVRIGIIVLIIVVIVCVSNSFVYMNTCDGIYLNLRT